MNVAVGLLEGQQTVRVSLQGEFRTPRGGRLVSGSYALSEPVVLEPLEPSSARFVLDDFAIGIGFHWQRNRRCVFQGRLRVVQTRTGLTAINDVELETYIESVISSEMSSRSPADLLRSHAVISRSWIIARLADSDAGGSVCRVREVSPGDWEILAWYGMEGHSDFDVCADDHCQRYQGIAAHGGQRALDAVAETEGQFLLHRGAVCDARYSKCCGGVSEDFRVVWEDREVPYLTPVFDGDGPMPECTDEWIQSTTVHAYCNTDDSELLEQILPDFDQETSHFFRWRVAYAPAELGEIIRERSGIDVGEVLELTPLARGRSGRIVKLRIRGSHASLTVGKELEIRRVLSRSHLYSSAFVPEVRPARIVLNGAGWGHGVGLCQIGAGVLASRGTAYRQILSHYYPGTTVEHSRFDSIGRKRF